MKKIQLIIITLLAFGIGYGQTYHVGYRSFQLKDSTRIYKPNTESTHYLHFRPVDLDIWYPSRDKKGKALTFGDLFELFEQRAINYQDQEDYSGITNELAQFYVAELGAGSEGQKLLGIETRGFPDLEPLGTKHPVIIYMSGLNGMGFENYRVFEKLAQNGYLVVSVWSVGRYPGTMTNQKEDMLEQVYDAEFAIRYLKENTTFNADFTKIGIIGCSWGGMSSVVFIERNPITMAFVSLDGTETHYFGEEDENDRFIQEIHDSKLFDPKTQDVRYLALESGNKLEDFKPSKDYNYFRELASEKYHLRFLNSTHADFTCIPSILETSENSVQVYTAIENLTLAFFKDSFENSKVFEPVWKNVRTSNFTTEELYEVFEKTDTSYEISGVIVDNKYNKPLPYINIGVLNREVGTVTDTQGHFTLNLEEEFANDTLRISSIGYKPVEILVKDVIKTDRTLSIELEEHIGELNEVVLTTKEFRNKTLGNRTESKFMSTGFSYDQLGAEMGVRINVRNNPTFVDSFNFNISYNRLSARSIFRVNFYSLENNKPKENILTENILVSIEPKQTGKITVDLKPYDIVLMDDVVVTLEWVDTNGENNKGEAIFFSLGIFNSGTLYKKTSQSKFKKHSSLGVGFNVDVRS